METIKEVVIEVPKGYEIDEKLSTFSKIVFKEIKKTLPKSWEELEKINGSWIGNSSTILKGSSIITSESNQNVFPTEEEAKAVLAMAKLCQLRDAWNGDWKSKDNMYSMKAVIIYNNNNLQKITTSSHYWLSFQNPTLRDEFFETFKDLIEQAKPFL